MGVDDGGRGGGNYGPRGEIQAPACASFLFRPSLPSHWLQACRVPLGAPTSRPARRVDWRWSETPSRTETRDGPIGTGLAVRRPHIRLHNHTSRVLCPRSGSPRDDGQLLARRLRTHLGGDHIWSISSVQSPQITKVAQPQRVAPLPWPASVAAWSRLSQAYIQPRPQHSITNQGL